MSDVHTRTSWSTIADSDVTYNTVLSAAGYDADNNRLFASVQPVPGVANNISTSKARGFYITSGYNGIVKHNTAVSESADLKTVVFTMSNAGQSYDLTDTRCYVRFKNAYTVDIASWYLQHEAEDDTLTTIASGTTITSGSFLEVDFKNDYGAGRFLLSINYAGGISYNKWFRWSDVPIINSIGPAERAFSYSTSSASAYGDLAAEIYAAAITTSTGRMVLATYTQSTDRKYTYYVLRPGAWDQLYQCTNFSANGNFNSAMLSGGNTYNLAVWLANNGYSYSDASDAYNDFANPVTTGIDTSDLNNYEGDMWQCYFISDIAQVFPGRVTESRGGDDATYDDTTDTNAAPALPIIDEAESTGSGDSLRVISPYAIYKLTSSQYHLLRTALFTSDFFTQIANFFAKPMDCIISVGRFPFTPVTAIADVAIYAGSVPLYWAPTTYSICKADAINRFQEVDLGSVTIKHYYDTALDYNPYTKAKIHLPFIGDRQIDIDLIMDKTISLKYHVDMITGSCIAYVIADNDLLVQYMGNCMAYAPLSGEDWSSVYGAILQATAQAAVSSLASGFPMAGAAQGAASAAIHTKIGYDGNTATGGATTLLECLQPYIELLYPEQVLPRDYPKYKGYISDISTQLINCSGFTQVLDIHLDNVPCTEAERQELHTLLGRGVII